MEIIYRASDGAEFSSKEDCQNHEKSISLEVWKPHIKGLDVEGKTVSYDDPAFCSKIRTFYCANQAALIAFFNRATEEGFTALWGIKKWETIYNWNDERDNWEETNQAIEYHKDEAIRLQRLSEAIMG